MSYPRVRPEQFSPQLLKEDEALSEYVQKLMAMREDDARRFIGYRTTKSAYRKVHEHIASAIDIILSKARGQEGQEERILSEALISLSRGLILVEYQVARGQLGEELGRYLSGMLNTIINDLRASKKVGSELIKELDRARILVDAIAVLIYNYAR